MRRLANQGVIDIILAEQMRMEAFRTALTLIGDISMQIGDGQKEDHAIFGYTTEIVIEAP